jgi:hypothetical protein
MRILVLASLLLAGVVAADDGGWWRVDVEHGITIDVRDLPDSPLREVRATAHAEAPPAAILAVLWKHEEFPRFLRHITHVEVLEDHPDERLVYERLAVPVVKDRDLVFRARKHVDPDSGAITLWASAVHDAGPPPSPRWVRVRVSDGYWRLVPAGAGSDVTYVNRTDGAGLLPAWILNRIQKATVPDMVRAILDRAAARR